MARIMAIDYGTKRCGIAVTDPLQTCAFALDTVPPKELLSFLKKYTSQEEVTYIVVGAPKQRDNTPSPVETKITSFVAQLKAQLTDCLLYTSPSPRDRTRSRMPSSA